MSPEIAGAGLGLIAAIGVMVAVAASPPLRRTRLDDRLAPYLRDASRPSRLLAGRDTVTPFPTVQRLLGPVLRDLAARIDGALGGSESVRRRLRYAGASLSVEQFRIEQVLWGAAGLLTGLVIAAGLVLRGASVNPVAVAGLTAVLTVCGVLGRDRALSAQLRRREARMLAEFPTIAEILALAVGAGEGPIGALDRVSRLASGELAVELGRALADTRAGTPVVTALERMAARTSLAPLARFVDGMAIAVERGTPLAEVLRAQANDVRETRRRALLEAGGRKEITMLLPVVFLILPITVVFALFPGVVSLRLAVP